MSAADPSRQGLDHDGAAPLVSRTRALLESRPKARRVLLVAAVVVVVLGVLGWLHFSVRESTDDAQVDGHIIPIAARVGGTALEVDFTDNQEVVSGAVLVQIDPSDYRVALQRAQAELADATAVMAAAETGVPIATTTTQSQISSAAASVGRALAGQAAAEARLASAQARLREATANDTRAQRDLERMKGLVAKDEVSQQQYDLAVAAAAASRAAVDSAQALVAEALQGRENALGALAQARAEQATATTGPQQVAVTRSRAESARARFELAKAVVEQARLNLEYTTVKAPATGVASKKAVEPGQVVQPGQPLLAVVPLEEVWITANFKETQLKRMRPGQAATIRVDAYGRTYSGHVDSIAAATGARFSLLPPENATGNYVKVVQRVPVKIVLDRGQDDEHRLRPGMSVVPTVITR
ncbi:MAG TPA: HlyD family secretion protein [Thermoanaerobaculaceae bacterium]|nr:HlyD family secretion protein [Thermoanaerobaculaceae bacterium]